MSCSDTQAVLLKETGIRNCCKNFLCIKRRDALGGAGSEQAVLSFLETSFVPLQTSHQNSLHLLSPTESCLSKMYGQLICFCSSLSPLAGNSHTLYIGEHFPKILLLPQAVKSGKYATHNFLRKEKSH